MRFIVLMVPPPMVPIAVENEETAATMDDVTESVDAYPIVPRPVTVEVSCEVK
jgi:hypothetical protein